MSFSFPWWFYVMLGVFIGLFIGNKSFRFQCYSILDKAMGKKTVRKYRREDDSDDDDKDGGEEPAPKTPQNIHIHIGDRVARQEPTASAPKDNSPKMQLVHDVDGKSYIPRTDEQAAQILNKPEIQKLNPDIKNRMGFVR